MNSYSISLVLLISSTISYGYGQTATINNKSTSCQQELRNLSDKKSAIDAEYAQVIEELKKGLFCSLCNRSKSQIEKGGVDFYQHIKDVKGQVVEAPPAAYQQAQKDYSSKTASLEQQIENKSKDCSAIQTMEQQSLKTEQQRQMEKSQQQVQQQNQHQQELMRQQTDQIKQQLAANAKEEQARDDANRILQQQKFSQSVSSYVNSQSDEIEQRRQSADEIGQQGSAISQSIIGNTVSMEKINPANVANQSIFSDGGTYEEAASRELLGNNLTEIYSGTVKDELADAILDGSNLSETFKKGYNAASSFFDNISSVGDLADGRITETTVNSYFSLNSATNPIIQRIQKSAGGLAIKQADSIVGLTDRIGEDDFSSADIQKTLDEMSPSHFLKTNFRKNEPINIRDVAVVVGGGVVLSTLAVPVWIGISAAAWYGFNR
ncbi:hypothetical protein [Mucilaginibacter aquaedulcis]|uniref:hypothetical protein n=1 Tax=Mucilaginibacter aquaedulcis TaxID=1187081 RepID=UPI0025B415FA|nr:hypothetical protein [Mucilaginibacter aquaedulcis]MDN3548948.1 hypothetical protein [Mucilaginibacter aquaedulcis]